MEMAKGEKHTNSMHMKLIYGPHTLISPTNTAQLSFSYLRGCTLLTHVIHLGLIWGLRNTLVCRVVTYEY